MGGGGGAAVAGVAGRGRTRGQARAAGPGAGPGGPLAGCGRRPAGRDGSAPPRAARPGQAGRRPPAGRPGPGAGNRAGGARASRLALARGARSSVCRWPAPGGKGWAAGTAISGRRRLDVVVSGRRAACPGAARHVVVARASQLGRPVARRAGWPRLRWTTGPRASPHRCRAAELLPASPGQLSACRMRMLVAWYPDWPVVAAGCRHRGARRRWSGPTGWWRSPRQVESMGYDPACGAGRPRAAARRWRSSRPMPAAMPGRGSRRWWPSRR